MKSILAQTQRELADTSSHGIRLISALGLATAATILAMLGMMSRYSLSADAPLPGMDHLPGQAGWSLALGAMMILSGWLVRNVMMRRLQYAIVASLLLHFLLGMFIQQLGVGFAMADRIPRVTPEGEPLEELTMPDYGGPELEQPEFDKPQENVLDEARVDPDRQLTEVEIQRKQQEVEASQEQAVEAAQIKRAQMEAQQRDVQALMQKQQRDQQAAAQNAEAQPEVNTESATAAELQARAEAERSQTDPQMTARQQQDVQATQSDPRVESTPLSAQRSQVRPDISAQDVAITQREASTANAATPTAAEATEVKTARAAEVTAQERAIQAERQKQQTLPAEQRQLQEVETAARPIAVNSVRAERSASSAARPSQSAPLAGGAQRERSQTAVGGSTSAASANAQSVQVAAAQGVSSPSLKASSDSAQTTRGSAATVPTGAAGGGGAPSVSRSSAAVTALGPGGTGQARTDGARAQLGSAVSNPASDGNRTTGRQQVGAVGTDAGSVAVTSATGTRASRGSILTNGPASTGVQRTSSGVPNRSSRSGTGPVVAATDGGRTRVQSGGSTGLTGRETGPSAQLRSGAGFSAGESGKTGLTRRSAGISLSASSVAAEQAGNLVTAGPQAASRAGRSSRGGLSGPRNSSVPRRTAGLPGLSGPRTTGVGRTRPALPGRPGTTGLTGRSRAGSPQPALASASELAGLVKRSIPGINAAPLKRISAGFSMRRPDVRRDAAKKLGGSDASERAVERGLEWLTRHQYADGHWSIHELNCQNHNCTGHGSFESDTAATGLALLAYLGAGYTHQSGKHQDVVRKGLAWLTAHQKSDGDLFTGDSDFVWLYSHGMAAIPLCEAYGMTHDTALKTPAQKAINFVVSAQHPEFGGWRYRPRFESDTSVSGWQLMALKSGDMAGLDVPRSAYSGVTRWLNSVESDSAPGRFKYHPSKPVSLAMTAEGLLMRQYLGTGRGDAALTAGADYLKTRLPREGEQDAYYWYYATQVMFHMQGTHWAEWNASLRDILIRTQSKEVATAGSWAPANAKWGSSGGRQYVTCLNLLMLEVYYRHLPLYIDLKD